MEIIPVIDVMRGKVVHARYGNRQHYSTIKSCISNSLEPVQFIRDLIAFYPFPVIYIADLDAIVDHKNAQNLYRDIKNAFPDNDFWLDAGVRTMREWQILCQYPNITPVIGSETLIDVSWLKESQLRKKSILSLDFKRGKFLGNKRLMDPEYWPGRVIAMNLDCVGSKSGPDIQLLRQLKSQSDSELIVAGGVRNIEDLKLLQKYRVAAVLIATALHNGQLTKKELLDVIG